MSNHDSNIDVDDVLSSVKRLVSDETAEGKSAKQATAGDRLVLTPAFRDEMCLRVMKEVERVMDFKARPTAYKN